jgi:hypothetical protein
MLLPQNINSSLLFDPISLITLFLDSPEKDLLARTGDLNLLSCFGLFVNPSTVWREYGTMSPDQGLRYYVPDAMITSTIEVAQVHEFLLRLACGRKNCGIIIQLQPSSKVSLWKSSPWVWMARPLLLCVLLVVAGLCDLTLWGFGAIGCLLLGQTIGIARTRLDGSRQERKSVVAYENQPEQVTTFFLANDVTILVRSHGDLFRQGVSSIFCQKLEKPVAVKTLTIIIFIMGVLMVGFSPTFFKVTYLLGHAVQAVIIALANASKLKICSVNGVTWQVENHEEPLEHTRNAYVWVTRNTNHREVTWLAQLMNIPKSLVELVREEVEKLK